MKLFKILFAVFLVALIFTGCRYSFVVPEQVINPDDPNAPEVSFASQIETIFNNNNNCTQCHTTGKQLPDLSTGHAYASLNTSRYINTASPDQSLIYTHPNPDNASVHTQKKYTAAQAALVLTWITQGAKNN